MEKKNKDSKSNVHVEVILVVPFGLEAGIFPWGVYSLRDYINNTCETITLQVWNFPDDNYFARLNKRYSSLLSKLFFSLKIQEKDTFFGETTNPYVLLGFAACTGEDFYKFARDQRWPYGSCPRGLRTLQDEVNAYIVDKINEYTNSKNTPDIKDSIRLWAISVYDRTLFNSLYITRLIKQEDPTASIILGGDYFDFQSAEEVIKGISFVDGIVVGPGEEVMRMIISQQRQGIPIRHLLIQGLVNHRFIGNPEKLSIKTVNIPLLYEKLSSNPVISCVQQPETGVIRMLTQLGCSWGKCSFCVQLDKNMHFLISVDHLIQGIGSAVEAVIPGFKGVNESTISISFDSDESDPEILIQLFKYLDSINDCQVGFDIALWLQVKRFRMELAETLATIGNKKIHLLFKLNFESLSVNTLKNMRKGHSPLQAIEAAKAIQDCGYNFRTNYFIHFPLDSSKSIASETEILKRIAHLLMPPKGKIVLLTYLPNNRDAIYQNQEKYEVKIKRFAWDTWLKDVFGVDLPFSVFAYTYDEKLSFNINRLLVYSYFKTIITRNAVYNPRLIAKNNWGETTIPLRERIAFFFRLLKFYAWGILHRTLQLTKEGKSFRQRTKLFKYLSDISSAETTKFNLEKISKTRYKPNAKKSHFFIEGRCLHKEYNIPVTKEKWSKQLSSSEINILRYLYWTRKRKDVIERFKNEMSEAEIAEIIEHHITLGSVVKIKNSLLCVVNDSGYWNAAVNHQ